MENADFMAIKRQGDALRRTKKGYTAHHAQNADESAERTGRGGIYQPGSFCRCAAQSRIFHYPTRPECDRHCRHNPQLWIGAHEGIWGGYSEGFKTYQGSLADTYISGRRFHLNSRRICCAYRKTVPKRAPLRDPKEKPAIAGVLRH